MYIEMKKTGLDVSDLITLVQRKGGGNTGFPYKSFVCRCSNCLYSTKGKCALKECCCMDERIRAHTCTFGEMMRYCFSGIGDNVFQFRLRIAIEREAELKSCFLDAGHRKRFYEGLAYTRKASSNLIAQIFLLSAYESLWSEAKKVLERNCVVYSALEISIKGIEVNPHNLFMTALDLEYGSAHSDLLDLSDDEVVDFDVFRMICYAVAISAYGLDAIKVSEKQRAKKYKHILVKEKADVYRYPFMLDCENLITEYKEDERCVSFLDPESGDEIFTIPTPFMTDAEGTASTSVFYEVKQMDNGKIGFTVIADSNWINNEEREFPVVIDPQINVSGSSQISTYSWNNGHMYNSTTHTVGTDNKSHIYCCNGRNIQRMYMKISLPTLPNNPRIKKAELVLKQNSGYTSNCAYPKFGLYHVNEAIKIGYYTPTHDESLIDYNRIKTGQYENGNIISYSFDITTLIDQMYKDEIEYSNLVLKMFDESTTNNDGITLYGGSSTSYQPSICVTYESSYGVNTSYRTNTHDLGRFGQGSIDLQCGNLMFDFEDFAWAGNRMPVTIKHLYNSALSGYQYTSNSAIKLNAADFSSMKVGQGWRLNIMQSMRSASFRYEGTSYSGYVYIGENGEETYFKPTNISGDCQYVDVDGNEMCYDAIKRILTIGSEKYLFDTSGRLVRITDEYDNHMDITYTAGGLTSVTDGAGREFGFSYDSCQRLTSITAPDGTSIVYSYTNDVLSGISCPDGKKIVITSTSNKPTSVELMDGSNNALYKVTYSSS